MTFTRRTFLAAAAAAALPAQGDPKRLARKDCYFGMHFDLHPSPADKALGRDVSEEMIERLLARVKPDFVQYDCKGHVGFLGYPSNVSASTPVVQDSLAIWRRVTARRGVSLFIHFSGVWDSQAVKEHPEWARVGPDGKPDTRQASTFGPYADERMIPQLKEAASKYDLDGAWIDGECWATNPDYCEAAARAFREATGIRDLPKSAKDRGWLEFLEINRERFRAYLKHYLDTLHAFRPGFQIASNWLYSTYVPERPDLPVDYISGDYLGDASISTARLEARYMSATGKPWDLMAWGFHSGRNSPFGVLHKPAAQLCQEAAVVLGQGGGFQVYYQPTRAGKLDDRLIDVMGKVSDFCRPRRQHSHKTEAVPQVGVLFSRNTLYRTSNKLFGGWGGNVNPARGVIDALLEAHYSVDVIPDWKLEQEAGRYPCIVVPDWKEIGDEAHATLSRFARAGGGLVIAGAPNARLFEADLGVRLAGDPRIQPAEIPGDEVFASARGEWQDIEPQGAQVLEWRYASHDSTRDAQPAATAAACGKGRIAAVYGPAGAAFAGTHAPPFRRLIARAVQAVFTPMVTLTGPATVDLALRRKQGRLLVHLSNNTAMQVSAEYGAVESVPPVGPLGISIRLEKAPRRVTLEPGGRPVKGAWSAGTWKGSIDRLVIHEVLAFEV